MRFSKEFFYDEVREGFYISGMMKRVWAAQMEVLAEVDAVCKRHGIKWFADCGTLLGTVRHGGYIPWDDDLDICMLRDDYQKFHRYALSELPDGYDVFTFENEEYWQMITRVVNQKRFGFEEEQMEKYHDCPFAVGIDIFVLDYVSPDPDQEEVRRKLVDSVISIGTIEGIDGENPPEEGMELIRMVEENCKVKLDRKNHLRRQLFKLAEQLSCMYSSAEAREVVLMPFWTTEHNHKYPIETVNRVVQMPFEGNMINAPIGYDEVLRIEYGDYLHINRKGGLHDYPIFQRQEDLFTERMNCENIFHYVFDRRDLESEKEEKPKRMGMILAESVTILQLIHRKLQENVANVEKDDIVGGLIQCQERMLDLGNRVEEIWGSDFITVHFIEEYCEALYQLTEHIMLGEQTENVWDAAELCLERIKNSAINDMKEKREILILPFRAAQWWTIDPLYRRLIADPENHVTVMPLPFYELGFRREKKDLIYDLSGYPEDIELKDYREYRIRERHPDVIYTQNAYDRYNYSYALPEEYYTSELAKYTEELVYVPGFHIGSCDPEDAKLYKTADYFVKIPGLLYADRIILESEEVRQFYIQNLLDFCGEDTRELWEKKMEVSQDPCCMADEKYSEQGTELLPGWRKLLYHADGKKRKTILYQTTISSFARQPERMLEKLKRILEVFYENREEIALIWRPHMNMFAAMDLLDRRIWLEYRRIVDDFRMAGWGILDETGDTLTAETIADAYYGDPDPTVLHFGNQEKPVMIQNKNVD